MLHHPVLSLIFGCILLVHLSRTALVGVPACPAPSQPLFILHRPATVGAVVRAIDVDGLADCSEHCARSQDCATVEFDSEKCMVLEAEGTNKVTNNDTEVLVKSCVNSARICSSPFHFEAYEQKILVGFAREVVSADTLSACLSACIDAFDSFGFECESAMFYPVDRECILNTEDRLDRPDLFVDEEEDNVIYLDNNCAGSQCYAPYITQYIAVEGKQLANELDRHLVADLQSCESLCTQRLSETTSPFSCKSFMYSASQRACILSDERSKPLGRAEFVAAEEFTYYEKKCFASPRTCRNVPSFSRVPQMILVGFAAFVMENVPSVTMCLDQCTNPPPETGDTFKCKSVMYYYNEQECILNAETRLTKPDLFIPEGDEFQVDYFDISCGLEKEDCTEGRSPRAVRTINAALPEGEGSLHVLKASGNSVAQCLEKCFELSPEKCRSFNFKKESGTCELLYLDGKTTLRPEVRQGTDLYDIHCLNDETQLSSTKDGTVYGRYLNSVQKGVASRAEEPLALDDCLNLCSTVPSCQGVNYVRRMGRCELFNQLNGNGEKDDHTDFYKNLNIVPEVDNGQSAAANVPPPKTPAKIIDTGEPQLATKEPTIRRPIEPIAAKKTTEGAPVAAFGVGTQTNSVVDQVGHSESSIVAEVPRPVAAGVTVGQRPVEHSRPIPDKEKVHGDLHVAQIPSASSSSSTGPATPPVVIRAEAVHTICNYEGIKVQVSNGVPFSGVVFAKNKYDSCRVEVSNSNSAVLLLGLPKDFGSRMVAQADKEEKEKEVKAAEEEEKEKDSNKNKKKTGQNKATVGEKKKDNDFKRHRRQAEAGVRECGLVDLLNGTYKSTVVVQTNNLGIPGLVTSMDQIYEVSCDYSSMLGGRVKAGANLNVIGPEAALIQPRGKIELGNPVLMQMVSANGEHSPVLQAKLGDMLELRWEIMAMDEELDFFVRDCIAEPGQGGGDEKLQLIENGCPTPAVSQKLIPEPIREESSSVKTARMQAFRFDSASSVRLICQLEICKGQCSSAPCNMHGEQLESFGRRKKRHENNEVTEYETARYKVPRWAKATTTLQILDPLQQLDPIAAAQHRSRSLIDPSSPVSITQVPHKTDLCLPKSTLLTVFGLLFLLTAIQAVVVAHYVFRRIFFNHSKSTASS